MAAATNIIQFNADIGKFVEKLTGDDGMIARFVQKIAFDLFFGIVERTPVDTGRARGNWFLTTNSPSSAVVYLDAKEKDSVPYPNPPDVSKITGRESVFIVNNLPYIEALEHGHSAQAPTGMVALTMKEIEATINAGLRA